MIAQILNRAFILQQLGDIQAQLRELSTRGLEGALQLADLPSVDEKSLNVAAEEAAAALERENNRSSGQPSEGGELRSGAIPIDDFSFLSRDPFISNVQSALESYFLDKEKGGRVTTSGVEDDSRRGGRTPIVTDETITRWRPRRTNDGRRIFDRFSVLDARWVSCLLAERWTKRNNPHHFVPEPQESIPVSDRLRLVLIGDWATGIPRARRVAGAIRAVLDDGKRDGFAEQHVVHLGDTYYSGWGEEYKRRFLPYWPVDTWEKDKIGSWSLNGNHDMYSGGYGYYEVLLQDERFYRQKPSSVFTLHNSSWQIFGLDTAYCDHDLKEQTEWIRNVMAQSNRKVIFLSHHQPFSAYEKGGEKLQQKAARALSSGRVRAWFWGHEHRCIFYKPHLSVEFGRCIGHGGVPVYMWHSAKSGYPAPAFYEYRDRLPRTFEPWAYLGFAVLDFDGPNINVRYINENGKRHFNPAQTYDEQVS